MKYIIGAFICIILLFGGFAFYFTTFDISTWGAEPRYWYVTLSISILLGGGMLAYLEPKEK